MTGTAHFGHPVLDADDDADEEGWEPGLWSGWRWPASTFAVAASLAHLPVMDEHLQDAPYMAGLFALFSLAVLGLAAALLLADTAVRYVLLGGWCLLAVLVYAATRTVAFPQLQADVGNWVDAWGLVALGAELAVAACCAGALSRR